MLPNTAAWFRAATSRAADWPLADVLDRKGTHRISVVIPARNEAATVADVVTQIRAELMEGSALVDELVVIDSDSEDDTADVAAAAGAVVHRARDIRPDLGHRTGKGEALWKSLFVTSGDLLVFIDADLTQWGPHFVTGLLGPLAADEHVELVKGFYDRLLDDHPGAPAVPQGGRVTELVARPLLNLDWPELSAVVQPLAGEWAIRRRRFARCNVPTGYGVELATLIDTWAASGLDAIAQVDLGERAHRHQSIHDLGVMAAEILAVAARRAGRRPATDAREHVLWQYSRQSSPSWSARDVPIEERQPQSSMRPPTDGGWS